MNLKFGFRRRGIVLAGARLLAFFLTASEARSQNPPSVFSADVTKTEILLHFRWDSNPGFSPDDAAEFEIHLTEHCFAMPVGGKDNHASVAVRNVDSNLEEADPYVDVWNYYQPLTGDEAKFDWENSCPEDKAIAFALPFKYSNFGSIIDVGGRTNWGDKSSMLVRTSSSRVHHLKTLVIRGFLDAPSLDFPAYDD